MAKKRAVDLDIEAEERQPLNAMVAENLKKAIIRKIYKDVDRTVPAAGDGCSPIFRQYLLATGTSFAGLSSGMTAGFSAVLLPQLTAEDSDFIITKDQASWIASLAALPMMLGCLCSGYPMDRFGRKPAVIVSSVVFAIGWAVLGFSNNVIGLYFGRFLTGFSVGLMSPMCQVYIAETCEPKHRGILLSFAPLAVAVGILMSHALGTFLHWNTTAFICGIPPLLTIAIGSLIPESPIWLLGGSPQKAEDSYKWFHGASEQTKTEWSDIVSKVKKPENEEEVGKFALIRKPSFLKPFLVLLGFFFVQQFSGVNAVAFYSVTILKEVIPTLNEYLATIIIDVVRVIISVCGVILLKKYGRKTLAVASAIGAALSLFSLASYLKFSHVTVPVAVQNVTNATIDIEPEGFTALHSVPLLSMVFYICFVSIGLVPIPWVLTGELFSKQLRGIGSGVTSSFGFICYFSVVKASPDMFLALGKDGTFALFGAVCLLGSVMLYLCLVETKDKTLLEIEAYYEGKSKKNDTEMGDVRY